MKMTAETDFYKKTSPRNPKRVIGDLWWTW